MKRDLLDWGTLLFASWVAALFWFGFVVAVTYNPWFWFGLPLPVSVTLAVVDGWQT